MDSMDYQGLGGKKAEGIKPVSQVLVVEMVGPDAVIAGFSYMDMHASSSLLHCITHKLQAFIRDCKWSMASDCRFTENLFASLESLVHFLVEPNVCSTFFLNFPHSSVSICNFETSGTADSYLLHTLGNGGKGSFYITRGSMVVYTAGGSGGYGIKRTDEG